MKAYSTKLIATAAAVLGLMAAGPGVSRAANILSNPDLDQIGLTSQINACPIGWNIDSSLSGAGTFYDGGDSETWCNVQQPNGYGFFFKPFSGAIGNLCSVNVYQDNFATPGTKFALSGYAACEANYSGLFATNSPAPFTGFFVAFLDNNGAILSSNAYDLVANGLSTGGSGAMGQMTTLQYTAPANTVTVRAGVTMLNVYNTAGAQSFFVDAFDLEATAPPGAPVISSQPAGTTVQPGGTVHLSVTVSNPTGVSYYWQHANTNLSNAGEYSGTGGPTLTITGASAADTGHYRVLVANGSGSVYSSDAPLALLGLAINPVISINGKVGDTYEVDYATSIAPTTWIPLSTNKLGSSTLQIVDPASGTSGSRFYRAVFLY